MRTTVNVEDTVLTRAHRFAESRSMTLGKAISELLRRGLEAERPAKRVDGLYVFDLPESSPKLTSKRVRELEFEGE